MSRGKKIGYMVDRFFALQQELDETQEDIYPTLEELFKNKDLSDAALAISMNGPLGVWAIYKVCERNGKKRYKPIKIYEGEDEGAEAEEKIRGFWGKYGPGDWRNVSVYDLFKRGIACALEKKGRKAEEYLDKCCENGSNVKVYYAYLRFASIAGCMWIIGKLLGFDKT